MKVVKIDTEHIKMGQFLKFAGIVFTGGESRDFLVENRVLVNEMPENRRGRKLFSGDLIEINGEKYLIEGRNDN